ncbi:hypothetical protein P152DRAFT_466807 [Eremomyces bilateralis CBS 781.70]|uniref:Xylanolytic transcriptional activator regulatory domain-containing protein n=1 Tax=Eremomyces bilateralis CBS 781.70 TaxID=1392243 RepID=A0A6G1G239_9PEZI|nr:uncharacterized protein P152DRAFT_466807 [Eremomyces bilateralis CBS 781.70]KAF1811991.1 hypothetical protein P152DRAFT_466807 [Eremomyces bilateralis CBS 781.70]
MIDFPSLEEARALVNAYGTKLSAIHHVVYTPTIRASCEDIMRRITVHESVSSGQAALLLSIFAMTCCFSSYIMQESLPPFLNSVEFASHLSTLWVKSSLDCIDHSRRARGGTVEDVQASIVLYLLVFNLEGYSPRGRAIFQNALSTARELSLHRVDFKSSSDVNLTDSEFIQKEIKRRIWWHLVSSDWLLALTGGPQEGTYQTQPGHMAVNLPRNINDEDFIQRPHDYERPLSEPTAMAYFLHRVAFSEICRKIVDTLPFHAVKSGKFDYNQVLERDRELEGFLQNLPDCLQLDDSGASLAEPSIWPIQRYVMNLNFHARRCKLHQPFLIRNSTNPGYSHSRTACLRSARAILAIQQNLKLEMDLATIPPLRFIVIIHYCFLATTVLVMDLCLNRSKETEETQIADIMSAYRCLQEVQGTLPAVATFLKAMSELLGRYDISINHNATPTRLVNAQMEIPTDLGDTGTSSLPYFELGGTWEDFGTLGHETTYPSWDQLFSEVESRFI